MYTVSTDRETEVLKMQDMKLTDEITGYEIAGHKNDGPNDRHETAGPENAGYETDGVSCGHEIAVYENDRPHDST